MLGWLEIVFNVIFSLLMIRNYISDITIVGTIINGIPCTRIIRIIINVLFTLKLSSLLAFLY